MREALVTRTINYTRCTVMALDTINGEVQTLTLDYTGTAKEDEKILKALKKNWLVADVILVKITAKEEVEQLYGMKESDFIKYAVAMDSRTQKNLIGRVSTGWCKSTHYL